MKDTLVLMFDEKYTKCYFKIMDKEYEEALEAWIKFGAQPPQISIPIRNQIHKDFYHWLVINILRKALQDANPSWRAAKKHRESAIEFLRSESCHLLCNDIGAKYKILIENVERIIANGED